MRAEANHRSISSVPSDVAWLQLLFLGCRKAQEMQGSHPAPVRVTANLDARATCLDIWNNLTCGQQPMEICVSVHYTPGQLRNAVEIPQQTYRHWKKALAPLRRERSHSPCFTAGDLVAVAVIRVLSVEMAIRVGSLTPIAHALFELCNSAPWPALERGKLLIDFSNKQVQFHPELASALSGGPLAIVPLRPIVTTLRNRLLAADEPNSQEMLRFPPTASPSTVAVNQERGQP